MKVLILFLLAAPMLAFAQPTFSLDDNPSAPLTSPLVAGFGASECEWGLTPWASPSLPVVPAVDGDLLRPGPVMMSPVNPFNYVDGISTNHLQNPWSGDLWFSTDRASMDFFAVGVPSEDVNRTTTGAFPNPLGLLGSLCGGPVPWSGVNFSPGAAAPFVVFIPGAAMGLVVSDGLDALDFYAPTPFLNNHLYVTTSAAELALSGANPDNIYITTPFPPYGATGVFANGPLHMGLSSMGGQDSIDALIMFDGGNITAVNPGQDCALFSLDPCSPTLNALNAMGWPVNGGTIFYTEFCGNFAIYAFDTDLGLAPGNVTALENR